MINLSFYLAGGMKGWIYVVRAIFSFYSLGSFTAASKANFDKTGETKR